MMQYHPRCFGKTQQQNLYGGNAQYILTDLMVIFGEPSHGTIDTFVLREPVVTVQHMLEQVKLLPYIKITPFNPNTRWC